MTAIRGIQFTGTLKNKWPDVKEFIFNDVLKDIDLSDIDRIAVHEITNDVVCNGRCYYPKKGSKRGCKLSVAINLKSTMMILVKDSSADIIPAIQKVRGTKELFLILLCHELFHYLSHTEKIRLLEVEYIENLEANANWFAAQQLIKWRAKELNK